MRTRFQAISTDGRRIGSAASFRLYASALGQGYGDVPIGTFAGIAGQSLELDVNIDAAGAALRALQLTITARLEPMRFKNAFASAQLNMLIGAVALVIAVLLLAFSGYVCVKSRKRALPI